MRQPPLALATTLLSVLFAVPSRADLLYTFESSPANQSSPAKVPGGDGTAQGMATIDIGNGTITITLEDLTVPGTGVKGGGQGGPGQELAGIILNLGSTPTGTVSFTSDPTGNAITIGSNGSISESPGPGTDLTKNPYTWTAGNSGAQITVSAAHNGADGLIIGPTAIVNGNPVYAGTYNIDSGNDHDPVQGPVTFTLTVPGITPNSAIKSVSLQFGTGPDLTVAAPEVGTPVEQGAEPATIVGAATGALMLVVCAWRKRRRARLAAA
jgi:hypothetical protein